MTPVVEYIKNVGKSFVYTTVEQLKMDMPATKEFMDSNEELFKDTYHSIMNIRRTKNRFVASIKRTGLYEAADYAFDNIVDSFKTGKFNDPYRQAKADSEMFDFGDFESGDSDMSISNLGDSTSTGGSMDENTKAVLDSGAANAKTVSTATLESARYIAGVSKANTSLLFNQTLQMNQTLSAGFSGLNAGMDSLNKFNIEVVQTLAQNATTFFQKTTDILKENNAMFKEFLEMQRNLYRKENEETKGHDLEDVLGVNGTPNLKAYKNMILKNIKNEVGEYFGVDLESILDGPMLKSMMANPLSAIPGIMMSAAMGPMLRVSLKKMDDTISGLFTNFLAKMTFNANDDNAPWYKQLFGKIFGAHYLDKSGIRTENTKNGPTPFDFQTKRAITEVIPGYLARIEAGITGNSPKLYDDRSGKWTDIKTVKRQFENQQESNKLQGSSELNYEMNRNMRDSNLDEKIIKIMNQAMEKVAKQRYADNGHLETFDGDISKFADYYGLDEKVAKLFAELYNSTSKETRSKTAGNIIQSKLQNIRSLKDEEKLGNQSLYRQLFTEGFDDIAENIGGAFDLNNMSDKHGATVFDYLRSIDINTSNIGAGKGKKRKGKGTWKDKQNTPVLDTIEEEENYNTLDIDEDQMNELAQRIAEAGKTNRDLDLQLKLKDKETNITDHIAELLDNLDELVHINDMKYKGNFGTKYITNNKTLQDLIKKAQVPGNTLAKLIDKANNKLDDGADIPVVPSYSDGAVEVKRSGIGIFSGGEIIIPNASEKQRKLDAINEEKIRQKFISQAKDAPAFSEGGEYKTDDNQKPKKPTMNSFVKDVKGWVGNLKSEIDGEAVGIDSVYNRIKEIIIGDSDKETKEAVKKVEDEIKSKVPNAATGGVLGAIGGTMIGGPLVGAVLGSALGIASSTETVQSALFGDKILDENGNDTGKRDNAGAFSQEAQKTMKKYLPDMKKFGIGGALLGMFTPFGILGGALMGSAVGFIKNNEQAQETLFGKDGLIPEDAQQKLKKYFPSAAKGGAAALFLGLAGGLGGVPLLGVAALGAGAGLLTTTDEFKDEILGKKGKDGKRHGGVLEEFKKTVTSPFKKFGKDMTDGFKKWFKEDIAAPVVSAMAPMGKQMALMAKDTIKLGKKLVKGIMAGNTGIPLIDNIMGSKVGQFARKWGKKLGGGALSGVKWLASAPSKLIGKFGDKLRERQIRMGNADYMTAEGRMNFMADKGDYEGRATDELLAGMRLDHLEQYKDITKSLKEGPEHFDENIRDIKKNLGKSLSQSLNGRINNSAAKELSKLVNNGKLEEAQDYLSKLDIPKNKKAELAKMIQNAATGIKESEYKRDNFEEHRSKSFDKLSKLFGQDINESNVDKINDYLNKEYDARTKEDEEFKELTEEDKLADVIAGKSDEQISELQELNETAKLIKELIGGSIDLTSEQKASLNKYAESGKKIMDKTVGAADKANRQRQTAMSKLFGDKGLDRNTRDKIRNDDSGKFTAQLTKFHKTGASKIIDANYFSSLDSETRDLYNTLSEQGYVIENIDVIAKLSSTKKEKLLKLTSAGFKVESIRDLTNLKDDDIEMITKIIKYPEMQKLPQKTLIRFASKYGNRFLNDEKYRKEVLTDAATKGKSFTGKIAEDNLHKNPDYMSASERSAFMESKGKGYESKEEKETESQKPEDIKTYSLGGLIKSAGAAIVSKGEKILKAGSKAAKNWAKNKIKEKFENSAVGRVYKKATNLKATVSNALSANGEASGMTMTKGADGKQVAANTKENADIKKAEQQKESMQNDNNATLHQLVEINQQIAANTTPAEEKPGGGMLGSLLTLLGTWLLPKLLKGFKWFKDAWNKGKKIVTKISEWVGKIPTLIDDGIKFIKEIPTKIKEFFGKVPELIDDGVKFIKAIPDKIDDTIKFIKEIPTKIGEGLTTLGNRIMKFFDFLPGAPKVIEETGKVVKETGEAVKGAEEAGKVVKETGEAVKGAEEAGKVVTEVTEGSSLLSKAKNAIFGAGKAASEGLSKVKSIFSGGEAAKGASTALESAMNMLKQGYNLNYVAQANGIPVKELEAFAKESGEVLKGVEEGGKVVTEGASLLSKIPGGETLGKIGGTAMKGINLVNFLDKTHSAYKFATADSMADREKMLKDYWNNSAWWEKGLDAWMTYDAVKYGKDLYTKGKNLITGGAELGKAGAEAASLVPKTAEAGGGILNTIKNYGAKAGEFGTKVANTTTELGTKAGEFGSKVADKAGGIAENMQTIINKVTELLNKCISKISSIVPEKFGKAMLKMKDFILKKLANPATYKVIVKAGGKALGKLGLAATGVGAIVTAGWMAVDGAISFYDGFNDAINILGLSGNYDAPLDVKMLAGSINAILESSIVGPIIMEPKEFADWCLTNVGPMVGVTREQLEEDCKKADENPPGIIDTGLTMLKYNPLTAGVGIGGKWLKDKITNSDTYKNAKEFVGNKIDDFYKGAEELGGKAKQTLNAGIDIASKFYEGIKDKSSELLKGFSENISQLTNFIGEGWEGLSSKISSGIGSVLSNLGTVGSNVIQRIQNSALGKTVSGLWNSAKTKFTNTKNWVSDKWTKFKNWVGGNKSGKGKWGLGSKEDTAISIFHSQLDPNNAMSYNAPGDTISQTMSDSACGPTSGTNALAALGIKADPKDAATYALKHGYKEKNGGTKDGFFGDFLGKYGVGTKHIAPGNATESMRKGKPVILMGQDKSNNPILDATGKGKTPFGTNPHYVVGTGYNPKTGKMKVIDSEDPMPVEKEFKASNVLNKTSIAIDTANKKGTGKWGTGGGSTAMGYRKGNTYYSDKSDMYNDSNSGGSGSYGSASVNDKFDAMKDAYKNSSTNNESVDEKLTKFDKNDVDYLLNNGYSKSEALKALEENANKNGGGSGSIDSNGPKKGTMALDWLMKHMPGAVITSKFKDTEGRPTPGEHGGIDIAAAENTPIPSTTDGEVVDATDGNPGYGNYVQVKDKAGNFHMYGHMNTRKVNKGAKVKTGDVLGLEGSTGQSTGPHVHYEIDPPSNQNAVKSGEHLNPATYDIGNMGNPTSGVNSTKGKNKNKKKYKGLFGAFDAIMDTLHAILFGEDDEENSDNGGGSGSYSGKFNGTGENAKDVFKYLVNNGYTETAAAAITGTWNEESGVKSKRIEGDFLLGDNFDYNILKDNNGLDDYTKKLWAKTPGGVNEEAYYGTDGHLYPGLGLAQWTGPRGQKLYEFGKDKWFELGPQIEFFNNEMSGSYSSVKQDINNTNSIENATRRFVKGFEGYEGPKMQARIDSAKAMFEQFGNGKVKNEKDDGTSQNNNDTTNSNNTENPDNIANDEYYTPQITNWITAGVEKGLSKYRANDVQYLLDQGYSKREALDALEKEAKENGGGSGSYSSGKQNPASTAMGYRKGSNIYSDKSGMYNNNGNSGGYGKWGLGLGNLKAKFGGSKWGTGNGSAIWEYLKGKGLGSSTIAGIMGNMQAESSLEPNIVQGGGHADEITVDGTTGYGLCQWTSQGRQQGLKDFAASKGTKSSDLNTQLDFMLKEVAEGYGDLLQKMDGMTPYDAALLFHKEFERSADTEQMAARRGKYAEEIAKTEGKGESFNGTYSGGANSSKSGGQKKYKGLFGAFEAITDVFKALIGADEPSGSSGSFGGVGGGHSSDAGIQAASSWANSMTGQQGFGNNGCTEFVKQYLQKAGNPVGQYMADGSQGNLMWVPTLEDWAKKNNMFKPASAGGAEGDVAICNDHGHVIIADGDGGYWGNSSSKNKIVHSTSISNDFNTPDGYISTGSGQSTVSEGKAKRSAADMMADGGTSNGWGGSKWGTGGIFGFLSNLTGTNLDSTWENLKHTGEEIATLWNPHLRKKREETRTMFDEDIDRINSYNEAIQFLNQITIPMDKIPKEFMIKESDGIATIRYKLRNIVSKVDPNVLNGDNTSTYSESGEENTEGLIDGKYEKNDVDYLINNGYTKEAAIELLSKHPKYAGKKAGKTTTTNKTKSTTPAAKSFLDIVKESFGKRVKELLYPNSKDKTTTSTTSKTYAKHMKDLVDGKYEKNDVEYLMNNGYTKEAALELLSKDPKYTKKAETITKKTPTAKSLLDVVKESFSKRVKELLYPEKYQSLKSITSKIKSAKPKTPMEFKKITDQDIDNVKTYQEAMALLRSGSIPIDKIPDMNMPKETDSINVIRAKLRKIVSTIKPEYDTTTSSTYSESGEETSEGLVDGKYEKNDVDYLMNNGYTKEAAIELLSKDPKYSGKKTNLEKKMENKSFNLDTVKKNFQDRVKQLVHGDKKAGTAQGSNVSGTESNAAAAQIDYTEKFDTMINLLSTLVQVFTNGTVQTGVENGRTKTSTSSAIHMVNSRNVGAVRNEDLAKLFTNINNSMNALASR